MCRLCEELSQLRSSGERLFLCCGNGFQGGELSAGGQGIRPGSAKLSGWKQGCVGGVEERLRADRVRAERCRHFRAASRGATLSSIERSHAGQRPAEKVGS